MAEDVMGVVVAEAIVAGSSAAAPLYLVALVVKPTPESGKIRMEQFAHLPPNQQEALKKLVSFLGPEGVTQLAQQGPDAVNGRLEAFSSYENALLEHLQQRIAAPAAPPAPASSSDAGPRHKSLMTREVEMAMGSAMIRTEHQCVALAISRLGGRAKEWALTEIVDYVQELRTLIAGMSTNPLPAAVTVTVLEEGLRTGVSRSENASYANSSSGPEPMDLSYAEDEEAELRAAEQRQASGFDKPQLRVERDPCFVSGKREDPVGAGQPTGEELSSVEPRRGGGPQDLASKRAVLSDTNRVWKPGLLVVRATVKGFQKSWTSLIDSGTSGNYARRSTMEYSQLYAEALAARGGDIVTRGTLSGLGPGFEIRSHPWHGVAGTPRALDRLAKRFWRNHGTEAVHVLDVGISELVGAERVEKECPERGAVTVRGAARIPLSGERPEGETPLRATESTVGTMPRSHGRCPAEGCGAALIQLSGSAPGGGASQRASVDTGALPELNEAATPGAGRGAKSEVSSRQTMSAMRRQRRHALAARCKTSELARVKNGVSSEGAPRESEQH
ncbi:hypothetical protein ON010_g1052 [Phytophthora cinnamomi]|nr:hypothetical protein ON010_g1052 [Phytophthora cinnamomi]